MRIVDSFDPSTETSTTFSAGFSGGNGRIVVYNESNYNLQIAWDGFSTYCPAWTAMLYCISSSSVKLNWQIQSQLVANGAPISQVLIEAYDNNEAITGTFPASLVRSTNIGNSVSLGTSATSIQNDGNVAGTNLVEATVIGDSGSAVSMTNDGHFALGTVAHPGSVSFDNGKITSDGTGILTVIKWILANLIETLHGNDLTLQAETTNNVVIQFGGSGDIVLNINTSGVQLQAGKDIRFEQSNTGIKSISHGQVNGLSGGTTTAITHNLGLKPTRVLVSNVGIGSQSTYTVSNYTNTTFDLYTSSNASYVWVAFAFD